MAGDRKYRRYFLFLSLITMSTLFMHHGATQNYSIKDASKRLVIPKIAAANSDNFLSVSVYIQNYKIKNISHLFEIAKIAAANSGFLTFRTYSKL